MGPCSVSCSGRGLWLEGGGGLWLEGGYGYGGT